MSTTRKLNFASLSTGTGIQAFDEPSVTFPDPGTNRGWGVVGYLTESVTIAQFTDGGGASGTFQLAGSVPAGATILGSRVLVTGAFSGDVSAALIIGDGSDTDRYMTGTPSVFAAAATGIETGVPSGSKLVTAANQPTLTVTTNADFTSAVTDAHGALTVTIYFLQA